MILRTKNTNVHQAAGSRKGKMLNTNMTRKQNVDKKTDAGNFFPEKHEINNNNADNWGIDMTRSTITMQTTGVLT